MHLTRSGVLRAFEDRFPIRRMRVMAEYGGDDLKAMADGNTSAYNCRQVVGDPAKLSGIPAA
ncbi:hypothetical protein ACFXPW_05415 [Streptomyces goshikiensis]|uniref:hypothetical protein n=1 Tax=Streptomyces goshikiensis TaxID=1942 RepID=UPI003692E523